MNILPTNNLNFNSHNNNRTYFNGKFIKTKALERYLEGLNAADLNEFLYNAKRMSRQDDGRIFSLEIGYNHYQKTNKAMINAGDKNIFHGILSQNMSEHDDLCHIWDPKWELRMSKNTLKKFFDKIFEQYNPHNNKPKNIINKNNLKTAIKDFMSKYTIPYSSNHGKIEQPKENLLHLHFRNNRKFNDFEELTGRHIFTNYTTQDKEYINKRILISTENVHQPKIIAIQKQGETDPYDGFWRTVDKDGKIGEAIFEEDGLFIKHEGKRHSDFYFG